MSVHGETVIRPFLAADRDGFAEVVSSTLREFGFAVDDLLEADLADPSARYAAIWVAVDSGRVVGTIAIRLLDDEGRAAELKRMFLRPEHRGQGLGRRLLDLALSWSSDRGCRSIVLDTSPEMTTARHLYESVGFVETGTRTESGANDIRREILYELRLASDS